MTFDFDLILILYLFFVFDVDFVFDDVSVFVFVLDFISIGSSIRSDVPLHRGRLLANVKLMLSTPGR